MRSLFFFFFLSAFTLSVCETLKYWWFWFSLTGISWKDILIAGSWGTRVNPWETMTSNGSRARDYQVCCGASTTWDLSGWKEPNSPRGKKELPSKLSRKVPVKHFSPVSHQCFRTLRFYCLEWFMFKGWTAEFQELSLFVGSRKDIEKKRISFGSTRGWIQVSVSIPIIFRGSYQMCFNWVAFFILLKGNQRHVFILSAQYTMKKKNQ